MEELRDGELLVRLTPAEMLVAGQVGLMREVSARKKHSVPDFAFLSENEAWGHHVVGALAEAAFAKALGMYWKFGVDTYRVGDVRAYEVRWNNGGVRWDAGTRRRVQFPPRLKIRQADADDRIVVLVRGVAPALVVAGWVRAGPAKRKEWLDAPRSGKEAYFVPLDYLGPVYTLPSGERVEEEA